WFFFRDLSQKKRPSGAFFSLRCLIYKVHAAPGGILLLYQVSLHLSTTFFFFFSKFLWLTSGHPEQLA
ncbi:hypothetical protein, partial [Dysosmobacter sp.]|uniref:hypothetical protein n=1 Tax=Dysosmobacter sp. TaxID=2591382 RepID=UPI003AB44F0E